MARRKVTEPVPASVREVREWAVANGHPEYEGKRGRMKTAVFTEFTQATGRPIGRVEVPETR